MTCACGCLPIGEDSCYLPAAPTPSLLRFGTDPQADDPLTGGGGGAQLIDVTPAGGGSERYRYRMPEPWGQLPGLSGTVSLHGRTSSPVSKNRQAETSISMGGEGCGSAVVTFSRPVFLAFLPILDFDNRSEQVWGVSPPFLGRVRAYRNDLPFSGTNPSPTAGGFAFTIRDRPLRGGVQPNECLPDDEEAPSPASRGFVFSTTRRDFGNVNDGALFFGYRRVSSVSWSYALPARLGIGFPWLAVVDQSPVRHARQHVCPRPDGTSTTEWRDSVTGNVLTAAQLATLDACP